MSFGGGQHHGGGGGGMMQVDFGFCSVHRRRRQKHDLIEDPDVPGQLRCTERRACRQQVGQAGHFGGGRNDVHDDANWCTCRLHGRRRNVSHMREVAPGEFECVAPYLCHSGPNPNQIIRQQNYAAHEGGAEGGAPPPHHRGFHHMPRYDNEHHPLQREQQQQQYLQQQQQQQQQYQQQQQQQEHVPAPAWVPNVPSAPAHGAHGGGASANSYFAPQQGAAAKGGAPPMYPGGGQDQQPSYNVDVWCARHGKHVAMYMCDVIDDVVYVCRDGQHCLAGPLDAPAVLAAQPAGEEVLCSRHATLRRPSFLVLCSDGQGYECTGKHPCRSTETHMIGQLSAPVDERANHQQGPTDGLGGISGWDAHGDGVAAWGGGQGGQSFQAGSAASTAASFFA